MRGPVIPVAAPSPVPISTSRTPDRTIPIPPVDPPVTSSSTVAHPSSTQVMGNQSSRTLTFPALDACVPIGYGKVPMGGNVIFRHLDAAGRLVVGYALFGHEIEQLLAGGITFGQDQNKVTLTQLGISGVGSDLQIYLGTSSQTLDATLHALDPAWSFAYNGTETAADGTPVPQVAYFWIRFPLASDSKPAVDPLGMQALGKWRKCRDPRLDPTLVTRYWTDNPALILADLKTSSFGQALPDSMIDWTTLQTAANDCDFNIGGGVKRYTFSSVFRSPSPFPDVEESVRQHFMGFVAFNSGAYQILVDKAGSSSGLLFTDGGDGNPANIAPGSALGPTMKPSDQVFTVIVVTYTDSNDGWKQKTTPPIMAPGVSTGFPPERIGRFNLQGITTADQAKRVGIQILNKSLLDQTMVFLVNEEGTQPLPFTIVQVSTKLLPAPMDILVTDVRSPAGGSAGRFTTPRHTPTRHRRKRRRRGTSPSVRTFRR